MDTAKPAFTCRTFVKVGPAYTTSVKFDAETRAPRQQGRAQNGKTLHIHSQTPQTMMPAGKARGRPIIP